MGVKVFSEVKMNENGAGDDGSISRETVKRKTYYLDPSYLTGPKEGLEMDRYAFVSNA